MNWRKTLNGLLLVLSTSLIGTEILKAAEVTVAVAANFAPLLQQLAPQFQQTTSHQLRMTSGSTGKLYAQISHGAPFDVLLSADEAVPARLVRDGLAVADSLTIYARGQLVVWGPSLADGGAIEAAVKTDSKMILAIANPHLAPYGAAAQATLVAMGLWDRWQSRLVRGESVQQCYQFVATGNAQMGFVALSQLTPQQRQSSRYWVVPPVLYPPLKQAGVVLKRGADNPAAQELLVFLKSVSVAQQLVASGYAALP